MAARVTQRQVEALVSEIQRYLEAVEVFRAAGCEPRWREHFVQPPLSVADAPGPDR